MYIYVYTYIYVYIQETQETINLFLQLSSNKVTVESFLSHLFMCESQILSKLLTNLDKYQY